MPPYREVYIWQCTEITDEEASWLVDSVVVTWDSQGGTPAGKTFHEAGEAIGDSIPSTAKEGYSLTGWWTTPEGEDGTQVDEGYVVTRNVTFYARWEKATYRISYDLSGYCTQNASWKTTYTIDNMGYVPTPYPNAEGHQFFGWSPEAILTAWGDMTFTALWDRGNVIVRFNAHGGTPVEDVVHGWG